MDFLPPPEAAARQAIDSTAIFEEWHRALGQARPYAGGMYFKKEGAYEYLVKTSPDNKQQRLGRRSPETEQILWMANEVPSRPPLKRKRDQLQARIVRRLRADGLLQPHSEGAP